jgi:uncharacterized protein YkwD
VIASLAVSLAVAAPASAAPCKYRNLKPTTSNLAKVRSAVRCLVNRERSSRGIAKLKYSGALATAAKRHSKNMVGMHFFDHVAPNGSTPRSRSKVAGYAGSFIGENIASDSHTLASPRKIVIGWMDSAPHRANILNPQYRHQGAGVARGRPRDGPGATYTSTFGGPR